MSYTEKVTFNATDRYGCGPENEDDVYTIAEFLHRCKHNMFIDYDGYGYPVKDNKADESICIRPSQLGKDIPSDATHIIWFNR